MKNWKRLIVLTLIVFCTVFVASCKSCSDDSTNKTVPAISNPNEVFLQIGDYKITNQKAYHQLLNSYGTETMLNILDNALLPAITDEADFNEYLDEVIYGTEELTDEEKTEAYNEFIENLPLSGLSDKETDSNYYVNYYKLIYRRLQYALAQYKAEIAEIDAEAKAEAEKNGEEFVPYFTEEAKENYFKSVYTKNSDLIIIRFDSQKEANYYLTQAGINLDKANLGWYEGETKLTTEQILAKFELIYQNVNSVTTSGVKTYTYTDLGKISAQLRNAVYDWAAGTYTKVPTTYNSNVYLVYKVSETGNLDEDGNVVTYEQKADDVLEALYEANVTSTYATKEAFELEIANGLTIYDRGLENFYKLTYDSAYSALSITDYDEFVVTDQESTNLVFSYTVNGTKVDVSADQLFAELKQSYGTYIASLYMKQYAVLKDNTVYNFITDEILDKDTYDEYYTTDIQEYKDAFNNGEYESLGYAASYGWENFVRDYLGLLSEKDIMINLDSSLYEACLAEYKENLYLGEEITDNDGNVTQTVDQKVQNKMVEIYNAYFNLTATNVTAYYDLDLDNTADEVVATTSEEGLLYEVLAKVYAKVNEIITSDDKENVASAIEAIMLEYKLANKNDATWGEYKTAGIELATKASTSYTSSSILDDALLRQLKTQYNRFISYKNKAKDGEAVIIGKDLSGVDISSAYRYEQEDTLISLYATSDDFLKPTDVVIVENVAYFHFVTKITKQYTISSDNPYPTYAQYLSYIEDTSSVISSVKNCITNYYIPAISKLTSDTIVNNSLVDATLNLLPNVTFSDKAALEAYINASKIVEE